MRDICLAKAVEIAQQAEVIQNPGYDQEPQWALYRKVSYQVDSNKCKVCNVLNVDYVTNC